MTSTRRRPTTGFSVPEEETIDILEENAVAEVVEESVEVEEVKVV
jgi:hypothetical protein